jgi:hypothetical protein
MAKWTSGASLDVQYEQRTYKKTKGRHGGNPSAAGRRPSLLLLPAAAAAGPCRGGGGPRFQRRRGSFGRRARRRPDAGAAAPGWWRRRSSVRSRGRRIHGAYGGGGGGVLLGAAGGGGRACCRRPRGGFGRPGRRPRGAGVAGVCGLLLRPRGRRGGLLRRRPVLLREAQGEVLVRSGVRRLCCGVAVAAGGGGLAWMRWLLAPIWCWIQWLPWCGVRCSVVVGGGPAAWCVGFVGQGWSGGVCRWPCRTSCPADLRWDWQSFK